MSTALYQKYRPKSFEEVIGQDRAVTYFKNIVAKDRETLINKNDALANSEVVYPINHAYLITGTRGVGKTTIARIFARELGTEDIDIVELDTASNRGIDEIKELREQIKSYPLNSKYRIIIMDEVHMITPQGANALLKTLEEPTPWTIFILCTTDPEKLITTIVSRCQVINLDNPTESSVASLLTHIAQNENINLDIDDLESIARHSHESYRDAIGLLEKITNHGKDNIKNNLGINKIDESLKMLESILARDLKRIFLEIESVCEQKANIQFEYIYKDLIKLCRLLLLLKVGVKSNESFGETIDTKLKDLCIKYKDRINSDLLKSLLDNESIWNYNSINDREKLELIMINIINKKE